MCEYGHDIERGTPLPIEKAEPPRVYLRVIDQFRSANNRQCSLNVNDTCQILAALVLVSRQTPRRHIGVSFVFPFIV